MYKEPKLNNQIAFQMNYTGARMYCKGCDKDNSYSQNRCITNHVEK